jgi:hypothetical protein
MSGKGEGENDAKRSKREWIKEKLRSLRKLGLPKPNRPCMESEGRIKVPGRFHIHYSITILENFIIKLLLKFLCPNNADGSHLHSSYSSHLNAKRVLMF